MTSASYALTASFGQESAISASSSSIFELQSGFWSHAGSGGVPIVLTARRNQGNPAHVDLDWSGNSSPYLVYRATDCSAMALHATEPTKAYTDPAPPLAPLICYQVEGQAPTPLPAAHGGNGAPHDKAPVPR